VAKILRRGLRDEANMTISGMTIIRDGVKLDYPFIESIQSAIELVDEFIVVVGDSSDGTRERIEAIGSNKIRIIDAVWDPELRTGGRILAQQTDIGLKHAKGDWILYLQADELLHEKDHSRIKEACARFRDDLGVDGFLFDYHAFWGYNHTVTSRRTYRREIRIVRNTNRVHSYKDAQGFRNFNNHGAPEDPGTKLRVIHLIGPHIYAYGRVRDPKAELEKVKHIARFWHDDKWISEKYQETEHWDYESVDIIKPFPHHGHPKAIARRRNSSTLRITPGKPKFRSFSDRISSWVEELTGWRIGEYRNYKIVGRI
jgi:glycosyltransferase involved in cell wall biosynthesis